MALCTISLGYVFHLSILTLWPWKLKNFRIEEWWYYRGGQFYFSGACGAERNTAAFAVWVGHLLNPSDYYVQLETMKPAMDL